MKTLRDLVAELRSFGYLTFQLFRVFLVFGAVYAITYVAFVIR